MAHWDQPVGKTDEWYTPKYVFDALGCVFDVDVAHPRDCPTFVPARRLIVEDSLTVPWSGFVWMNAPFGGRNGLEPWLTKFFAHGSGIALTPDRTSAPWFRDAWAKTDLVLFTPKIRFHRPDMSLGDSPSNGIALFGVGQMAQDALSRAADVGLGILGRPITAKSRAGAAA